MPKRQAWQMKKASDTVGEINIYDTIGDPWDGTTAKGFAADLKALGSVSEIQVQLNSPGGYVFDAVAIYNQLTRHRATTTVNIDGLAASAASVIAMAGNQINIALNGMMMIHDPWVFAMGSGDELRKIAESLDTVRGTILDTYVARTGGDEKQISQMMNDETWFGADEAVELGFADAVTGSVDIANCVTFDLSKLKNVPDTFAKTITESAAQRLGGPKFRVLNEEPRPPNPIRLEIARRAQTLTRLGIERPAKAA